MKQVKDVFILDDINVSKKKIMSAVTDSDNAIYYDVKINLVFQTYLLFILF